MKVHHEVDCGSCYVHTITGTAANVHDLKETSKLLRLDDQVAYVDSGYLSIAECTEIKDAESLKDRFPE